MGCREAGRGSLDILPVFNLPTSKNQIRTNSRCNRETILTFRLHILDRGVLLFFFFNPLPSSPEEPTPLVSIPWVCFSCFDLYKTELLQCGCAAWLPQWDLLTFQRAVDSVLYPCRLVFGGVNVRPSRLMGVCVVSSLWL